MSDDFSVGVIGDLSGAATLEPERFQDVDRDTFGDVFARLRPRVALGLPFCEELLLGDWDDWTPDGLLDRVPMLAKLREARGAAGDASRMRAVLAEAGVAVEASDAEPAASRAPAPEAVSESALLDDLLGGSPSREGPVRVARHVADPAFEQLVAEIAAPHAERIDHAGIAARKGAIDAEIGARTRTLLRHPAFRRREALWRSLRALVFGAETGAELAVRALDAGAEALRGDAAAPLAETLHRRVVTEEHGTVGGRPFGLLIVDVEVGGDDADLALLGHLGRVAGDAGVPCLVGAGHALWQPEGADAAAAFLGRARALPGADRIALCAPRMLTRIPYGRASEPVERFAFEEVEEDTGPEGFTWGHAGFAVASAALEAVAATGTAAQTARFVQREGLPFHPRPSVHDCAGPTERVLPDSELERLRALGILPIAGVRGRDTAVITSLGSLTGAPLFRG